MGTRTINSILAASTELFGKKGFDGVSLLEIAGKAKIAAGTIIYHFKTKENLFFILTRQILYALLKETRDAIDNVSSPSEALDAVIDTYFNLALNRKSELLLLERADPYLRLDTEIFPIADILYIQQQYIALIQESIGRALFPFSPHFSETTSVVVFAMLKGAGKILAYELDININDFKHELKQFIRSRIIQGTIEHTANNIEQLTQRLKRSSL